MGKRGPLGLVLPLALALAMTVSACGAANESGGQSTSASGPAGAALSGIVKGAGASTQMVAQTAWIAKFTVANPGVRMSYDPIGSGGGRRDFIDGAISYGGSDALFSAAELTAAEARCHNTLIEFPVYISPVAIAYNLPGVKDLKIAPSALAEIFTGKITNWNDPAISATNPGISLPNQRITPVHRSDDSGTTANFTDYLSQAAPDAWSTPAAGQWPSGLHGEAAQGTAGVVKVTGSTAGAITYADASQVAGLDVALVKVGSEFVGPTADAAAKIFADSKQTTGVGKHVITFELNRTTQQSGTYPIVLASYEMACGKYDSAGTAALVKAYLTYVVSDAAQQLAASEAGSAPLPLELVKNQILPAIDSIAG